MWTLPSFDVHEHYHLSFKQPERDQALFTVGVANVFARDREVVPDGITAGKVKTVICEVLLALLLVPRSHIQIVFTNYSLRKDALRKKPAAQTDLRT